MHSPAYLAAVLAAAKLASANVLDGRANTTPSPVTDDEPRISSGAITLSRNLRQLCASSVMAVILPEHVTKAVEEPWAVDNLMRCTGTIPASASGSVSSFMSEVTEWAKTVKDVAVKQTDCGIEDFVLTYPQPCRSGHLYIFTDGESDARSTSYGPIPWPSGNITVGAEYNEAKTTSGSGASGSLQPTPSSGSGVGETPKPTPSGNSGSNNEGGKGDSNEGEKGGDDKPKDGAAPRIGGMVGATVVLAGVLAAVLAL